jgi:hypothetical protein
MPIIHKYLSNEYYSGLFTSEYKLSSNFNLWIDAVLNILNDITTCLLLMDYNFDLDYAVGVQLTTLGAIVGVSRTVPFQPSGGVSPILDDDTYRLLIRATIGNNHWDGNIDSLYPIWKTLFPGGTIVIQDNQDMTANVILTGSFTSILQDLITHGMVVPRPETVKYNYIFGALPLFGFDRNDGFIAGFDTGFWS